MDGKKKGEEEGRKVAGEKNGPILVRFHYRLVYDLLKLLILKLTIAETRETDKKRTISGVTR